MLEQETEQLVGAVGQRFTSIGPSVALKDILAADIPYPVKAFFRADVEAMLLDELAQYHKGSRFGVQHPEVQNLQQQMNSLLVMNYEFKREEFMRRLDDTVHLIVNYFIRPQWTLVNVLFEKEELLPSTALVKMFRYFGAYEYMKDVITRYVGDKRISSFTKKEFAMLLWKVDCEYVKRKSGGELAKALLPAYEFFDFPKKNNVSTLPTKALIKYFEDKGLSSVVVRLAGEEEQNKPAFTLEELGNVLEGVRRSSGAFEIEEPEHVHSTDKTAEQSNGQPEKNFLELFSEDDKQRFIKKIFCHSEPTFHDTLKSIGKLQSWKEASKVIDEIFIRNNINPYASDAVRFVEIISQQFHQKVVE